ncbi:MAG: hypothetical protein RSF40_08970 [Oscillospiraceae bacterium]
MTTTTSYSNKHLFVAAYKNALRRLFGIGALYTAISILTFPVMYFLSLNEYRKGIALNIETYAISLFGTPKIYPPITIVIYFAILVMAALLMGVVVNKYMHSKKAVDVYHSLPIKKETLLLANYSAVMTTLAVPMLICYLIVMVGNISVSAVTMTSSVDIIVEFLKIFSLLCGFVSIITLSCVSTCASFDAGVFALALNAIVPAVVFMKELMMNGCILGYSANGSLMVRSAYTSPIALLFGSFCKDIFTDIGISNKEITIVSFAWILFAAILLLCSMAIYKKRNSELAQSYDTSGILYKIITIVSSFGVATLLALLTSIFDGGKIVEVKTVLLSAIYGFLAYFVINGILARSLKTNKKNVLTLILSTVIAPTFIFLIMSGWFGYENYLPKVEDIKSVTVNYSGRFRDIVQYARKDETNINSFSPYSFQSFTKDNSTFEQSEGIQTVYDLHKSILADNSKDNTKPLNQYRWTEITYNLKNGKKVTRDYHTNCSDETLNILTELEDNQEMLSQQSPLLFVKSDRVKTLLLTDGYNKSREEIDLSPEQLDMLYTAMGYDLLDETVDDMIQTKGTILGNISIIYDNDFTHPVKDRKDNLYEHYENVNFQIREYSVNTIKAFEELGLKEKLSNELPINTKAVIEYANYYKHDRSSSLSYSNSRQYNIHVFENLKGMYIEEDEEKVKNLSSIVKTTVYRDEPIFAVYFIDKNINSYANDSEIIANTYFITYSDAPQEIKDFYKDEIRDDFYGIPQTNSVVAEEPVVIEK